MKVAVAVDARIGCLSPDNDGTLPVDSVSSPYGASEVSVDEAQYGMLPSHFPMLFRSGLQRQWRNDTVR